MIPQWCFRHPEVHRDLTEWKMQPWKFFKIWPFLAKLPVPPRRKKSIFGPWKNIPEKGVNQFSVSENIPGDTFQASQGTGDKEIAHKGWSYFFALLGQNWKIFLGHCLYLKMIPQWCFRHPEVHRDLTEWKMQPWKFFKIWPFLAKLPVPPRRKKSIFGPWKNIPEKGVNQFSVSENIPGDTFQASQGTGDKEIAHKGWSYFFALLGQNWKIFLGHCLYLKMIPQWCFRHPEVHRDLTEWKMQPWKFFKIWPFLAKLPVPPRRKKSIFGPWKNIPEKGVNQFSVSENIPGDTFQASQGTGDKEIAHKGWSYFFALLGQN